MVYALNLLEGVSLLKNSLYACFGPRSSPKHTVLGAFWSFWSLISSNFELSSDLAGVFYELRVDGVLRSTQNAYSTT
jgi:hypothetical protein